MFGEPESEGPLFTRDTEGERNASISTRKRDREHRLEMTHKLPQLWNSPCWIKTGKPPRPSEWTFIFFLRQMTLNTLSK